MCPAVSPSRRSLCELCRALQPVPAALQRGERFATIGDRDVIDRILTDLGIPATSVEPLPSSADDLFGPTCADIG